MKLPRQPFSWDGDDRPVPLGGQFTSPGQDPDVVQEAEAVVRGAQDDLAREETDPYMSLPALAEDSALPTIVDSGRSQSPGRVVSRRVLAAFLSAACVAGFSHGWASAAQADACGRGHCLASRTAGTIKEECDR